MQTWLTFDEFCKLTNLNKERVEKLIVDKKVNSKKEDGVIFIEASSGTNALIKSDNKDVIVEEDIKLQGSDFLEKTIGTILSLHEKVISSKDETLEVLKNENQFLKEALFQMQDLYDSDRKTIDTLNEQLKFAQDELESIKRKYRLMWGRAIETGNKLDKK
jgi:hypothetical protein